MCMSVDKVILIGWILDIGLFVSDSAVDLAHDVMRKLGLSYHDTHEADLKGGPLFAIKNKSTPVQIVTGGDPAETAPLLLDLILPSMPWVPEALTGGVPIIL